MLILSFETANFGASIALTKDSQLIAEKVFHKSHGQAGFLIPEIQAMMKASGTSLKEVKAFVTTTGPGSFTGLRLGLSVARTLNSLSQAPVLGVPSPFWVANAFLKAGTGELTKDFTANNPQAEAFSRRALPTLVCLDARRDDLYCQLFNPEGEPLKEIENILPKDLPSYAEGACYAIGNGLERLLSVPEFLPSSPLIPVTFSPRAGSLCLLGETILQANQTDQFPLMPLYVREPDTTTPKKSLLT